MFTLCSHYVHIMFTLCSHYVHFMFTLCTHYVLLMFTLCSHYGHIMFTLWSHYVHFMFTLCTHYVHLMFTLCSHYVLDDNECRRIQPCSHYCQNTPGSFSCSCPPGLSLSADGRICKGYPHTHTIVTLYACLLVSTIYTLANRVH